MELKNAVDRLPDFIVLGDARLADRPGARPAGGRAIGAAVDQNRRRTRNLAQAGRTRGGTRGADGRITRWSSTTSTATCAAPPAAPSSRRRTRSYSSDFAAELASEAVAWKPVNYEEPSGAGLAKKFDVVSFAVVLAKMQGDEMAQWKRLDRAGPWSATSPVSRPTCGRRSSRCSARPNRRRPGVPCGPGEAAKSVPAPADKPVPAAVDLPIPSSERGSRFPA